MKKGQNKLSPIIFRVCLAVVLVGTCVASMVLFLQNQGNRTKQPLSGASSSVHTAVSLQAESKPESKPVPKPVSITILGVGDDLIHDVIYKQAQSRAGGKGYDFSPVYSRIAKDIKNADISVINQETPIAGKIAPPSGYPRFNSPTELGDELVNLGFDVINHANNHVLDRNEAGLAATLDYWATKPSVKVVGAYRNDEDLQNIRIVESKGIKTAHIGITEMTNGLFLPKNSDYRLIYANNTELIEKLIKKAKSMADVVVISVHWGNENTYTLSEKQKTLAQNMVDWGADIIFGNHPHVLQKLTVLTRKDGTKCPVIFAFGNLVSAQQSGDNMVSGMLTVTMTKDFATNKTAFTDMKFKPIVTHYGKRCAGITIYPLSQYTDALAAVHGVKRYTPAFSLKYINKIVNQSIPEEYLQKD
ncbi:CapA family protein [Caproiciproducens faecalis]|uniref:CapA family protein n=1 Tax=Caproiciproducens faecalis TaxID=2820301 RepID=A0ABS7DQ85_9FIRM|nr:CapA family protein [Caproiciproducens faecalis]MBW7573438.1 CapA family protein [Caproiciproducens faecalis]